MMGATMITRVSVPTTTAGVRHVLISLPLVPCLVADLPQKYFEPGTEPVPTRSDISARAWSGSRRRIPAKAAELP
jgi:hypothetical protein